MTSNRLVPTTVVDRNGKQTTVHKRLDPVSKRSSSMPAPAMDKIKPVMLDHFPLMVESALDVAIGGSNMSDSMREKLMDSLHPETKPRIENMLRANRSITAVRTAMSWCADTRSFAVLNSLTALAEESETGDASNKALDMADKNVLCALMGLQSIRAPKTPPIDLTNEDDPRSAGVREYVRVLVEAEPELIRKEQNKKRHIQTTFEDPELGNLIIERPDRADEIVSLFRSRGSYDRDSFIEALDNSIPSLSEGAL